MLLKLSGKMHSREDKKQEIVPFSDDLWSDDSSFYGES